jgi:hypothetical protein
LNERGRSATLSNDYAPRDDTTAGAQHSASPEEFLAQCFPMKIQFHLLLSEIMCGGGFASDVVVKDPNAVTRSSR